MTTAPAAVPAADAHNDLLMLVEHFRDDPGYFRRNWLPTRFQSRFLDRLREAARATAELPADDEVS